MHGLFQLLHKLGHVVPYTISTAVALMSSLMTECKPRRTKGRTCVQRGVAGAMRAALRDWCVRSTNPLDEGWYRVVLILLIPKHVHNSRLR
ncbi:hypothetical protein TNIN_34661 [Trichonephila inaurata madagascariensis]|uniref:Uncharacterized protein n=1 Tax=Trichonephila inaurata madagascariensis TaxID=2747483 RepID=A0A8X7CIQ9_9ARAC|nr:hypothetical protein TNIN_34661 [Trichonephila inaurata madagascariensis]